MSLRGFTVPMSEKASNNGVRSKTGNATRPLRKAINPNMRTMAMGPAFSLMPM